MAVVVGAVGMLYSGHDGAEQMSDEEMSLKAASEHPLLCAVPSDAAMILYGSGLRETLSVLDDSTYVLGSLFSGTGRSSFRRYLAETAALMKSGKLSSLKNAETVVSMHYSGDLVPLLVVDAGKIPSDSTGSIWEMMRAADSAGVSYAVIDKSAERTSALKKKVLVAFSSSEPLVRSCGRHVDGETSVLDGSGCAALALSLSGSPAVMVNNEYSSKLASSFLTRGFRGYSPFMKSFAEWTGFTVDAASSRKMTLSGNAYGYESPSYFSNVFRKLQPGRAEVYSILPASVSSVFSLQLENVDSYIQAYRKYLDAVGKIEKNRIAEAALAERSGLDPEIWARALDIREVARASVPVGSKFEPLVLCRPGKVDLSIIFKGLGIRSLKEYDGSVCGWQYGGFAANVFGSLFDVPDSSFILRDGWLMTGSAEALSVFTSGAKFRTLSDAGVSYPAEGTVFQAYCSLTPETLSEVAGRSMLASASKILDGVSFCPLVFSIYPGDGFRMAVELSRTEYSGAADESPVMVRDTVVNVPEGPFKVKNCGTGKMNLFSQQPNNYLVLKEESGKGIWGVPFQSPICGAVAGIDYFANGKIQFLFASGSSLYLIDRLGRFVKPFPVDLGKEILLGPDAYDFTGAHGYTVTVLHKDNTIGMYDLHGKSPSSWKGIKSEETIKTLPELLRVKGKRYWAVRTSVRTVIYGFDGGEPVYNPDGNRIIRPDAKINVNDNGSVTALCLDGKERVLKL